MRTVFCDGACEPVNPGGTGACAFAVFDGDGAELKLVKAQAGTLPAAPSMTNNVAEYRALRAALLWLISQPTNGEVRIRMDSQLVVSQVNGTWKCNKEHLAVLRDECRALLAKMPSVKLSWVPREQNNYADNLTTQALLKVGIKPTDRSAWKR